MAKAKPTSTTPAGKLRDKASASKDLAVVNKSISSLYNGDLSSLPAPMKEQLIMADVLAKSQAIPMHYIGKPAAVFSAIQWGKELGVPPVTALNNMYNVNGKTAVSTALHYGLAAKHPGFRGMVKAKVTKPKEECKVVVKRAFTIEGQEQVYEYTGEFTMDQARTAGLVRVNSPWTAYPERMLFNRALAIALREAFPDVLAGVYTYEELKPDISIAEVEEVTLGS